MARVPAACGVPLIRGSRRGEVRPPRVPASGRERCKGRLPTFPALQRALDVRPAACCLLPAALARTSTEPLLVPTGGDEAAGAMPMRLQLGSAEAVNSSAVRLTVPGGDVPDNANVETSLDGRLWTRQQVTRDAASSTPLITGLQAGRYGNVGHGGGGGGTRALAGDAQGLLLQDLLHPHARRRGHGQRRGGVAARQSGDAACARPRPHTRCPQQLRGAHGDHVHTGLDGSLHLQGEELLTR